MPPHGAVPTLHAIAPDLLLADPAFPALAEQVLAAGGPRVALHLRSSSHTARALLELALTLRVIAERTGSTVVIADRVDVALAAGVQGAHLTSRSLDLASARRIAPTLLLGVTVPGADEAWVQAESGADFLVVALPAPGAPDADAPMAVLAGVAEAAGHVPVIAVGNVTPDRVSALVDAGADGVGATRGLWHGDAGAATHRYLAAYDEARSTRRRV